MMGLNHGLLALLTACAVLAGCNDAPERPRLSSAQQHTASARQLDTRGLPPEAVDVLATIKHGGPFPYRKDGTTFQNREKRLPERPRGYYREYTVPTPGERTRGPRRIVTGGKPPEVFYYTPDHYRSFKRIPEQQ